MKKLIICVDDERIVLNSLQTVLHRNLGKGYDLEFLESSQEVLEVIQEYESHGSHEIVVIISDWLMPEIKGDELLAKIKSSYPDIKGIILSGQADPKVIREAIQKSYVDHFIQKPWEEKELIDCILE